MTIFIVRWTIPLITYEEKLHIKLKEKSFLLKTQTTLIVSVS